LKSELAKKGIGQELIDQKLEERGEEAEFETAIKLAEKKTKSLRGHLDRKKNGS